MHPSILCISLQIKIYLHRKEVLYTVEINPQDVGKRIKIIRQNLGLSMDEFAKRINSKAKSGTVSNWETGKNLPNNTRLKKISELGNVTIDFLLYGNSMTELTSDNEAHEPLKQLLHFLGLSEDSPKKAIDNKLTQFLSSFFESDEDDNPVNITIVPPPDSKQKSISITETDLILLKKYKKLNSEKKKQLNDFADFLLNQE